MRAEVTHRLLMLQTDRRYGTTFWLPTRRPYENNQHHIIVDLLKGDWEYWLSIDADNPPMNNPLDLVELGLDFVGLPTPIWCGGVPPIYWNAYSWHQEKMAYKPFQDCAGLQEVDAVGSGCFVASRRVFEHPSMQRGCFSRTLREDGTVEYGNDMAFCQRAKRAGFSIHCHFGYPCRHFSEVDMHEIGVSFKDLLSEKGLVTLNE